MAWRRWLSALVTGAVASALPACYSDEHKASATGANVAAAVRYPTGVLSEGADASSVHGIYPAMGDDVCCWTGPNVTFRVLADSGATSVHMTLYEPKLGPFATQPQAVSVQDARGHTIASRNIGIGATAVVLALPPGSVAKGVATIHLKMSRSFVPKAIGLNADPRTLAIILQSADVR